MHKRTHRIKMAPPWPSPRKSSLPWEDSGVCTDTSHQDWPHTPRSNRDWLPAQDVQRPEPRRPKSPYSHTHPMTSPAAEGPPQDPSEGMRNCLRQLTPPLPVHPDRSTAATASKPANEQAKPLLPHYDYDNNDYTGFYDYCDSYTYHDYDDGKTQAEQAWKDFCWLIGVFIKANLFLNLRDDTCFSEFYFFHTFFAGFRWIKAFLKLNLNMFLLRYSKSGINSSSIHYPFILLNHLILCFQIIDLRKNSGIRP